MLMLMVIVMVKLILFVDVDVACMLTWYAAFACYGLERFQPLFSSFSQHKVCSVFILFACKGLSIYYGIRFVTIGGQSILQYYRFERKMEDTIPFSAFKTVKNHHYNFFLLLNVDL